MTRKKLSRRSKSNVEELADKVVETSHKKKEKERPVDWISTGSTVLNLASSQLGEKGGWPRGRIIRLVGDGSSGKTLCALEACAQAVYNMPGSTSKNFPKVKKVVVVYNNIEGVMDFPIKEMYGEKFASTVEFVCIRSVEGTGRDLGKRLTKVKPGTFFLYVIDSWDFAKSEQEFDEFDKAAKEDQEQKKNFGQSKPSYTTQKFFPNIARKMEGKDALIIIIAQTRDNIGVMFGPKKRVGGGGAFGFYTHQEPWLREVRKLSKKVRGKEVIYGVEVEAQFKRNKVALPFRKASFTIYFDYGIDDVGSMLDWYFGKDKSGKSKSLTAKQINSLKLGKKIKKGSHTHDKVVRFIEKNNLEGRLQDFIESEWHAIEAEGKTKNRKVRFDQ